MWALLGLWMKRRQPLPAPTASIGWKASPSALRHMIELLPEHRTIGVIDDRRELVGVIEVEVARASLSDLEGAPIIVADLI